MTFLLPFPISLILTFPATLPLLGSTTLELLRERRVSNIVFIIEMSDMAILLKFLTNL